MEKGRLGGHKHTHTHPHRTLLLSFLASPSRRATVLNTLVFPS